MPTNLNINLPAEKICNVCNVKKSVSEFRIRKNKYGVYNHIDYCCKDCKNKIDKEYRLKNQDKLKDYFKNYSVENKDLISQKNKKHREKNKEELNLKHRNYYAKTKEYHSEWAKEYRERNKEKLSKRKKEWADNKRKTDDVHRFKLLTRHRINRAINNRGKSSAELLGCSGEDGFNYLLSMGYDKSKHQIDHIIPIALFDLTNEYHQMVAFNFKNIQPLSKSENVKKQKQLPENWLEVLKKICIELCFDYTYFASHFKNIEMKKAS